MKKCAKCSTLYEGKFCRPCKKVYLQEYRKANKERIYSVESAWRKANPTNVTATRQRWKDKNKNAGSEYYAKNSTKIKQKVKEWYLANKQKASEYKKAYFKANPEVRPNCKAKRRLRGGSGKLTYGVIPKLYKLQKGLCPCCKQPLGNDYHVDHIVPLALGGKNEDRNIQLLRGSCNMQKHAKHPIDFMQERGFLL